MRIFCLWARCGLCPPTGPPELSGQQRPIAAFVPQKPAYFSGSGTGRSSNSPLVPSFCYQDEE
jgi:hypothetical protein